MNGLDYFIKNYGHIKNVPIGVLTNHAVYAESGLPAALELLRQGYLIKKLFSPEHGINSQDKDGKEQINLQDKLTNLPIISMYGKTMNVDSNDLKDVEIILIDLPNIGCRFYTYLWTISYMIEACASSKKTVILLDRPNLSGRNPGAMEGPLLDENNCSSFLGRWSMPLSYAYSYGQIIQWFIKQRGTDVTMDVVPFDNKNDPKNKPFIPTSPSMVDLQTVLIYPFTGLFEGLNLNNGRGTGFPFRVIGAPWIDSVKLFTDFTNQQFPGIVAFPYTYQPLWSLYADEFCNGLFFYIKDTDTFRPVQTGIWLMNYLSIHYDEYLKPYAYPTAANPTGEKHLDLLLGHQNSFDAFCSGKEISGSQISDLLDVSGWIKQFELFHAQG